MAKQRQDMVEWVGGSYPSPKDVIEHGVRTRAEVAIWIIQPGGLVVNTTVGYAPMPPDAVANALTETLELPLAPGNALRVRVADPAVADAVRRQLGDAVPVVVAPTPDLDAIADGMQRFLGRMRRPRDRGYLQRGQIPPDDVAWLFRAAADLWTVAPWRVASDDQVLALDVPALGIKDACVSILGQLQESFGFVVFESFDAFARFADQMPDDGTEPDGIDMSGCLAALDFTHRRDLSKVRRREIQTHGWQVAAPDAHPHVVCADADGMPRAETADEVRLVAACAEALAAFCRRHVDVFEHEPTGPTTEAVEIHAPNGSMIAGVTAPHPALLSELAKPAPPPPRVGRNDPCPCGSGRKYKKCHLDARPTSVASVPSSPAQVRELDFRMMRTLLTFGDARQRELAIGPDVRLTGHPAFDGPWLVFHERIGGRRLIDRFVEARHHALDPTERAWIVAQQETRLSMWEVVNVVPGKSLALRDQLTGERHFVSDDDLSRQAHRGDRILARVLTLAGITILSGVHGRPLRPSAAAQVTRTVRRRLGTRARVVAPEALRSPLIETTLRDAWEDACAAEVERLQSMTLANMDGHALLLTVDHFVFAEGARREVEGRIEQLAARIDEDDTATTHFNVSVASDDVAGLERISIANVEVRETALRIETNSRERADTVRSLVEGACGALITHRAREHTDPRTLIGRGSAPPTTDIARSPEAMQLVLDFKRRHYATWPDEHLPALDGLTPREAATRPAMRRRLALLLDDMEHGEQALPDGERFDFDELRAALGLDR